MSNDSPIGDAGATAGGIIAAFIGLAIIAITVSNSANTVNVLTSFFSGVANLIGVAISPITGQSVAGLQGGGLLGGNWSNAGTGTGGFSLTGTSTGNNGGFLGGLGGFSSLLGGGGGGGSSSLGGFSSLLGGGGGGSGGAQDFIDSGAWESFI